MTRVLLPVFTYILSFFAGKGSAANDGKAALSEEARNLGTLFNTHLN